MNTRIQRGILPPLLMLIFSGACDPSGGALGSDPIPDNFVVGAELLTNPGFEAGGDPVPQGWTWDRDRTGSQGTVSRDTSVAHEGSASIRVAPNANNRNDNPLAIAQIIPADQFRGQHVQFSGYMRAENGAAPLLGMLSLVGGRPENLVLAPGRAGESWASESGTYRVPDKPGVQLVFTAMVNGTAGSAWFDALSVRPLVPGGGVSPTAGDVEPMAGTIEVDAGRVLHPISRDLFGTNVEWRWNANFLWDEARDAPDPEMLRLTREMGVTLIRYPGGLYSDFYRWRQGIGPRSQRPEVVHEPGRDDRSRILFGTDEALAFADSVGAELLITVNAGSGTPEEAADWVRYVNREGLRVRYWEVGNELYIRDESPISKAVTIDPTTYTDRFLKFAAAMREADPRIQIGAIGGENQGRYNLVSYPDWNRILLQRAGSQIDFLAVHNAYAPVVHNDRQDARTVYRAMMAAPILVERNLETLTRQIRQYVPQRADQIAIAVTEWGPFFHVDFGSRYVDHAKTLGSALYSAAVLKEMIESPKTRIANFWLLNDVSVLGWIGSRSSRFPPDPDWIPTAKYYAFQIFSQHFGDRLVQSSATSPTFTSEAVGLLDAVSDAPWLDAIASVSGDGRRLYIVAINKHLDAPLDATIRVRGFEPRPGATTWTLTGAGIDAHTGTRIIDIPGMKVGRQVEDPQHRRFSQGGMDEISFGRDEISGVGDEFTHRFPARSVTSIILERR